MPARKPFKFVRLWWKRRFTNYQISTSPHFDTVEAVDWFRARLAKSSQYLEYGSGGSTFLAAQLGIRFITVEPNPHFLKAVKRRIKAAGFFDPSRQTYRYRNVGMTKEWGVPANYPITTSRRLRKYALFSEPDCPEGWVPDLVLVDGRFRVACALKAIRLLQPHEGWTLVVDDYPNRPQYSAISKFARLEQCIGTLAVFTKKDTIDLTDLNATIEKYQYIFQ